MIYGERQLPRCQTAGPGRAFEALLDRPARVDRRGRLEHGRHAAR